MHLKSLNDKAVIDLSTGLLGLAALGGSGDGSGSGGGMDPNGSLYFTCNTVDSETKTWTGYKWTWSSAENCWKRDTEETIGLTYGEQFIPEVGNIYNNGATVRLTSLYSYSPTSDGPIPLNYAFYAPLTEPAETAVTGQPLIVEDGEVFYETVQGRKCLHIKDGANIKVDLSALKAEGGYAPVSASLWFYINDDPAQMQADGKARSILSTTSPNRYSRGFFEYQAGNAGMSLYSMCGSGDSGSAHDSFAGFSKGWHHLVLNNAYADTTQENPNGDIWLNGVKIRPEAGVGGFTNIDMLRIGACHAADYLGDTAVKDSNYANPDIYLAQLVLYRRTLTDAECRELYSSRKFDIPDPLFWAPGSHGDCLIGSSNSLTVPGVTAKEGIWYMSPTTNNVMWTVPGLSSMTKWTIALRICPQTTRSGWNLLQIGGTNRFKVGYAPTSENSGSKFWWDIDTGEFHANGEDFASDNSVHLALSYDGEQFRWYVNGRLTNTSALSGFLFDTGTIRAPDTNSAANGYFTDLRIIPECCTQEQIANLAGVLDLEPAH